MKKRKGSIGRGLGFMFISFIGYFVLNLAFWGIYSRFGNQLKTAVEFIVVGPIVFLLGLIFVLPVSFAMGYWWNTRKRKK